MRKIERIKNKMIDQINQDRLHKKFYLTLKLVEAVGRSRTDAFDTKNSKS